MGSPHLASFSCVCENRRHDEVSEEDKDLGLARTQIKYWLTIASLIAAQVSWLAYLSQAHFEYQLWPFLLFSALPATFIFVSPRQSEKKDNVFSMAAPFALVVVLAFVMAQPQRFMEGLSLGQAAWTEQNTDLKKMVRLLDEFASDETFYVFSTNVSSVFPAAEYSQAKWNFRYHVLWPLPAIVRSEREGQEGTYKDKLVKEALFLRQSVVADFQDHRPVLVLVDVSDQKSFFSNGGAFDYLAFFNRSQAFRRAFESYIPCGFQSLGAERRFAVYLDMGALSYDQDVCQKRQFSGILSE